MKKIRTAIKLSVAFATACAIMPVASVLPVWNQPANRSVCAPMSDKTRMIENLPGKIWPIFDMASHSPITGRPLFDFLTDPVRGYVFCEMPMGSLAGQGAYHGGKLMLNKGVDFNSAISSSMHEGFHALQAAQKTADMMWGGRNLLTRNDVMNMRFLLEATAVAYTYVYAKEADAYFSGTWKHFSAPRKDAGIVDVFDNAYAAASMKYSDMNEILQFAGQAVVEALIMGKNEGWTTFYANYYKMSDPPQWPKKRNAENNDAFRETLVNIGKLSDTIRLTPESVIYSFMTDSPVLPTPANTNPPAPWTPWQKMPHFDHGDYVV